MTKNIIAFDLETTGLNTQEDYILQIALIRFDSQTFEELAAKSWYIKPEKDFTINEEAAEKIGFTKEFILQNGVSLKDIWDEAVAFIGDDDMLSYNGIHFDIPMLYNNLTRSNLNFDFSNRKFYDAYVIERKRFSCKLIDTYKRYTGKDFEQAHDAYNDTQATIEVFKNQILKDSSDIEQDEFILVSPEGFLKKENGNIVFTTGKYKGKRTNDVVATDQSYIRWVFDKFSKITKETIKNEWYREHPKNEQ